jgi:hypothetical protein
MLIGKALTAFLPTAFGPVCLESYEPMASMCCRHSFICGGMWMTHTQTPVLKYGGTTIGSSAAIFDQAAVQLSARNNCPVFLGQCGACFSRSKPHARAVGRRGNGEQTTWALVKSGYQVLPVQIDQYLGSEKVKIKYANAQGLWGEVAEGVVQKLLTWEAGKHHEAHVVLASSGVVLLRRLVQHTCKCSVTRRAS